VGVLEDEADAIGDVCGAGGFSGGGTAARWHGTVVGWQEAGGIGWEAARTCGVAEAIAGEIALVSWKPANVHLHDFAAIGSMVLFEDVATGNFRVGVILGAEFSDIDAIFAVPDFFFEDVNARVVHLAQFAGGFVEEEFHKAGT